MHKKEKFFLTGILIIVIIILLYTLSHRDFSEEPVSSDSDSSTAQVIEEPQYSFSSDWICPYCAGALSPTGILYRYSAYICPVCQHLDILVGKTPLFDQELKYTALQDEQPLHELDLTQLCDASSGYGEPALPLFISREDMRNNLAIDYDQHIYYGDSKTYRIKNQYEYQELPVDVILVFQADRLIYESFELQTRNKNTDDLYAQIVDDMESTYGEPSTSNSFSGSFEVLDLDANMDSRIWQQSANGKTTLLQLTRWEQKISVICAAVQ